MSDDVDAATEHMEILDASSVAAIRDKAARIPKGEPGECSLCGEHSPRLVRGACAPCRDRKGLP